MNEETIEKVARAIHNATRKNGQTCYTFEEVCNNVGLKSTCAYQIAIAAISAMPATNEKASHEGLVAEIEQAMEIHTMGQGTKMYDLLEKCKTALSSSGASIWKKYPDEKPANNDVVAKLNDNSIITDMEVFLYTKECGHGEGQFITHWCNTADLVAQITQEK